MQYASLTIAPGTHRIKAYLDDYLVTVYADGSGRCNILDPDLSPVESLFTFDRYRFGTDDYGNLNLTFVGARFLVGGVATNVVTDHVMRVEPAA